MAIESDITVFGCGYEVHPGARGGWVLVHCGSVVAHYATQEEAEDAAEEAEVLTSRAIMVAVEESGVSCPEQVADRLRLVADTTGDWRAELARAVANDPAERRALGIE